MDKNEKIKKSKERKAADEQEEFGFMRVYVTPKLGEIAVIKSLLDSQGIPYHIKGETFGTLCGPADGLSAVDVMVREDNYLNAKELLKDFIKPPSK